MNNAGFYLPKQAFRKIDPRGTEYGIFYARANEDGTINVIKINEDGNYKMNFPSHSDFTAWAHDCT